MKLSLPRRTHTPPTKCRSCGLPLRYYETDPYQTGFAPGPFYMCPKGSPAQGVRIEHGYVVVCCDF